MKKIKFDRLMLALSFLLSAGAAIICRVCTDMVVSDKWQLIIWSGVFFAAPLVFALIGISVVEVYRRSRYEIQRRGNRAVSFAAAVIGSLIIGCAGQALYMQKTANDNPRIGTDSDISIMMNSSNSMYPCAEECRGAIKTFVKAMEEETGAQLIVFANTGAMCLTDIEPMTDDNKKLIYQALYSDEADMIGGSDYNMAFGAVCEAESNTEHDNKAAILITAHDVSLDDEVTDAVLDAEIRVYCVNITDSDGKGAVGDDFLELIEESGGFTAVVKKDDSGKLDREELEEALLDIYDGESGGDGEPQLILAVGRDNLTLKRIILRFAAFILYALLISWVYYYTISAGTVLSSIVMGAAAALSVTYIDVNEFGIRTVLSVIILALTLWSAFTQYRYRENVYRKEDIYV